MTPPMLGSLTGECRVMIVAAFSCPARLFCLSAFQNQTLLFVPREATAGVRPKHPFRFGLSASLLFGPDGAYVPPEA